MLAADQIVLFEDTSTSQPVAEEKVGETMQLSDAEMRAMWLRRVQTKPADFLRAKFAYQLANAKKVN
ncbi:hypothetical protein [Desulforhopalus singaporensis]|uniref:Uncharacterized protein n=1 Tax=Desulforhopalus singaporensis TaxID=91360 RepID=A0A1H0VGQ6_9BACT|nr:hypothetical protein [Desulforhopalus singaporensis]SDP77385.1 hypothetical protein SAMN05660330_04051 [Desulforhopalus singaporensis]